MRDHETKLKDEKAKGTNANNTKQIEFHSDQILHFKNMLVRQLTTGIFKEAAPQFKSKIAERKGLQAELSRISQITFADCDLE